MHPRLSLLISFLAHPVFVNLLSLVLLTFIFPSLHYGLSTKVQLIFIAFIFTTTGLIPAAIIGIMKVSGRITSIMLHNKEDRTVPYLITASLYLFNYWISLRAGIPPLLSAYLLACASIVVAVLLINYFNKVSIHMASLGALLGVLVSGVNLAEFDIRITMAAVLVLAGVTASARLFAQAHLPQQLYSGLLVGFAIMISILQ